MTLKDGIDLYFANFGNEMVISLERQGGSILNLINHFGANPTDQALNEAMDFVIRVEAWKLNYDECKMGNALENKPMEIWSALSNAIIACEAKNDSKALLSIMALKGFGSVQDANGQRRTKIASAVLRFLWPEDWGVIDWRNATLISSLNRYSWDTDLAINKLDRDPEHYKKGFEVIDVPEAIKFNNIYRDKRNIEFPKSADIDMAIFGISMIVWPFPKQI